LISLDYFPATFERNVGRKCISGLPKWQTTVQIFKFFFHEGKWIKKVIKYSIHRVIQEESAKLPGYVNKAIFSKKKSYQHGSSS
jgi:hypothetical protein